MKKTIGLILIVAVMLLVFVGGVFAAAQPACDNSQAPVVASDTQGAQNANQINSVFACSGGPPG